MSDLVTYETGGPAAVLTLNRPERRNAIDAAMCEALRGALARLDTDPAARIGILTGAGNVFCAGMDLQAFLTATATPSSSGRATSPASPPRHPPSR